MLLEQGKVLEEKINYNTYVYRIICGWKANRFRYTFPHALLELLEYFNDLELYECFLQTQYICEVLEIYTKKRVKDFDLLFKENKENELKSMNIKYLRRFKDCANIQIPNYKGLKSLKELSREYKYTQSTKVEYSKEYIMEKFEEFILCNGERHSNIWVGKKEKLFLYDSETDKISLKKYTDKEIMGILLYLKFVETLPLDIHFTVNHKKEYKNLLCVHYFVT